MGIPYTDHVTNEEVLRSVGQSRAVVGKVISRKLKYFGLVSRHTSLEIDIMLGLVPGTRGQGGQGRQWLDDITDWTSLKLPEVVHVVEDRVRYHEFVHRVVYAPRGVQ